MPQPKKSGKSVTFYLDGETATLYDAVKQGGEAVSPLFGEFLRLASLPTTALATVQHQLYSLGPDLDDDPFRFEKWIDAGNTK